MELHEEYKIFCLKRGQSAPYKDTIDIYRVEWYFHDWSGQVTLGSPFGQPSYDEMNRQLEIAKVLTGATNWREKSEVDHSDIDQHFAGWYEVIEQTNGTVTIAFTSPWND